MENLRKCHFSNYLAKSKFYDDSKKLVVGKMKDETASVSIKEFVGIKPKMYLFLVDDSSDCKKGNGVNTNVVEKITHNEYKDVLLNQNCYIIQSKNHRIGTYEMNRKSLLCFDDKIYIQNNRRDGLALGDLNNYSKPLFCQAYFNFFSSQNSFFLSSYKNIVFIFFFSQNSFFVKL